MAYLDGHRVIIRGRFPVLTDNRMQRVWLTDLDTVGKDTRVCDERDLVPLRFPPLAKIQQLADVDLDEDDDPAEICAGTSPASPATATVFADDGDAREDNPPPADES
jgi:hypothetical protein